jgi:hypothetical protein
MRISLLRLLLAGNGIPVRLRHSRKRPTRAKHTFYYDRNVDGQVDLEKHKHPEVLMRIGNCATTTTMARTKHGLAMGLPSRKSTVAIQVPTDVGIETDH